MDDEIISPKKEAAIIGDIDNIIRKFGITKEQLVKLLYANSPEIAADRTNVDVEKPSLIDVSDSYRECVLRGERYGTSSFFDDCDKSDPVTGKVINISARELLDLNDAEKIAFKMRTLKAFLERHIEKYRSAVNIIGTREEYNALLKIETNVLASGVNFKIEE